MAGNLKVGNSWPIYQSVMTVWILVALIVSTHTADAAPGDNCTQPTNCSLPLETCSGSTCTCLPGSVRDSNTCKVPAKGQACQTSPGCSLNLLCVSAVCQCAPGQAYNGTGCLGEMVKGQACNPTMRCKSSLQCLTGFCSCDNDHYYDDQEQTCQFKLHKGQSCSEAGQCTGDMTCLNGVCDCNSDQEYYNHQANRCQTRLNKDVPCNTTDQCQITLSCISAKCDCDSNKVYDQSQCLLKKAKGESCSSSSQCQTSLTCIRNICDCPNEDFYNDATKHCEPKRGHSISCSAAIQCVPALTCGGGLCVCASSNNYFNSTFSQCSPKIALNQTCSASLQCIDTLTCLSNLCTCTSTQYYDTATHSCMALKTYNQTCTSSSTCRLTLVCLAGTCSCASDKFYDPADSQCKQKISHGGVCYSAAKSPCQTTGTSCVQDKSHAFRCLCSMDTHYWNDTSGCLPFSQLILSLSGSSTISTVTLTWTPNIDNATIFYKVSSPGNKEMTIMGTSCTFVSLSPGTLYNFTILSTLPSDTFYPERTISRTTISVWTRIGYAGSCYTNQQLCADANTACITSVSAGSRCLCISNFYRSTSNTCRILHELSVTSTNARFRNSTSILLSWTPSSMISFVSYIYYSVTSSLGGGLVHPISSTSVGVYNLMPGTSYMFSIASVLPADTFYPMKTSSFSSNIWTTPEIPGTVSKVKFVSETAGQYTFDIVFGASLGQVAHYTMTVGNESSTCFTATCRFRTLKLGQTNYYNIVAYNGNNDTQETSSSFPTPTTVSGPVSNLEVLKQTSNSGTISWGKPGIHFGDILGYLLDITQDGICEHRYSFTCSDCSSKPPSASTATCQGTSTMLNTKAQFNDSTFTFNVTAGKLEPYTNYTLIIYPLTVSGLGNEVSKQFMTQTAAANRVKAVWLSSFKDLKDSSRINLNVTWTPGNFTGPTNYQIVIESQSSLNSNQYRVFQKVALTDKNTSLVVYDVQAFWNYSVTISAETSVGGSIPDSFGPVQTLENTPGTVENFKVENAENGVLITFECPPEAERNGTILAYTIHKVLLGSNNKQDQATFINVSAPQSSCLVSLSADDVGGVLSNRSYTFAVSAVNQVYGGQFTDPWKVFIPPASLESSALAMALGISLGGVLLLIIGIFTVIEVRRRRRKVAEDWKGHRPSRYNSLDLAQRDVPSEYHNAPVLSDKFKTSTQRVPAMAHINACYVGEEEEKVYEVMEQSVYLNENSKTGASSSKNVAKSKSSKMADESPVNVPEQTAKDETETVYEAVVTMEESYSNTNTSPGKQASHKTDIAPSKKREDSWSEEENDCIYEAVDIDLQESDEKTSSEDADTSISDNDEDDNYENIKNNNSA